MAGFLRWFQPQFEKKVVQALKEGMSEIGLRVETESKKELYKGRGVITGTLRRSIHVADPDFSWDNDDVKPSGSSPERGGRKVFGKVTKRNRVSVAVGAGVRYAKIVHNRYKYITTGTDKVRGKAPSILKGYLRRIPK